jgi:hypothetical protein
MINYEGNNVYSFKLASGKVITLTEQEIEELNSNFNTLNVNKTTECEQLHHDYWEKQDDI